MVLLAVVDNVNAATRVAADFVGIVRDGSDTWLLTDSGEIFLQRDNAVPVESLRLRRSGTWSRPPLGFARWRNQWLVVDGSNTMLRFAADGAPLPAVSLRSRATDIAATPARIWIYAALPGGYFSTSRDGIEFQRIGAQIVAKDLSIGKAGIAALLILSASADDVLYTHMVGAPNLFRVSPRGEEQSFPLAYRRTAQRDSLTEADRAVDDDAYSSVARDIAVTAPNEVVVLRNWEDEPPTRGARPERWIGRRADLYDLKTRKHLATATFAEPIRWILRKKGSSLIVLARSGKVIATQFGAPVPSMIFK